MAKSELTTLQNKYDKALKEIKQLKNSIKYAEYMELKKESDKVIKESNRYKSTNIAVWQWHDLVQLEIEGQGLPELDRYYASINIDKMTLYLDRDNKFARIVVQEGKSNETN